MATIEELIDTADVNRHASEADEEMTPLLLACQGNHPTVVERLLTHPDIQLECSDVFGYRAIHHAAKGGRLDILSSLLLKNAEVNAVTGTKQDTALIFACEYGKEAIVEGSPDFAGCIRLLLSRDADVNKAEIDGWTPLHTLCRYSDDVDMVRTLIGHWAGVDTKDPDNYTPLIHAAFRGCLGSCEVLLEHGAAINTQDDQGATPLFHAAQSGYTHCIDPFIRAGADVTLADINGWTPLGSAAFYGHVATVEALVAAGSNVNHQANDNMTALSGTVEQGHSGCLEVLLKAGAELIVNDEGDTPLMYAAEKGHLKCMEMILERDQDVNVYNDSKETALYCAAKGGHTACLNRLLQAGADPKRKSVKGCTPLHAACMPKGVECAQILVPLSDRDAKDDGGRTALYWACQEGQVGCVELLLSTGANPNTHTEDKSTPLKIAIDKVNIAIVKLLLRHRVRIDWKVKRNPIRLAKKTKNKYLINLLTLYKNNRRLYYKRMNKYF